MTYSGAPSYFSTSDHERLAVFGVESEPEQRTLVDIALATFRAYPDAIGMESDTEALTFQEFEHRILEQVERLHGLGIGRGDRVGIRVPSGTVDLYVAILATIFAGAAYVPVDWDDPDSRANTVWEEASVAAVFGKALELTVMDSAKDPSTVDTGLPTLDDDAWIIFTSGSTGKPKGVAITHRSAAALVDAEQRMYLLDDPLGPQDRVMAGLSVAFDASCEEMWLAWRTGATLVAAHRDTVRSGDVLGRWLVEKKITAISTVPTLAAFWSNEDLQRIRLLIFGGEALPFDLIERLHTPGREIWNTYGPTEATVIASGHLVDTQPPVRIGRPVPGWQLVVVNEQEELVEWGETGQLIIGGVGLGRYLDEEKDRQVYAPLPAMNWDRAYRTGDLVTASREGLVFMGRADDQIKFAGRRLELGEIDDKLTACTNVRIGAAQKHKTPAGSDVLVGYLVAEEGAEIDTKLCRTELAATMPGGIVPVLCVLDEMPTKTSGKVDRKALPWPLPAGAGEESADLPAHLQQLAKAWTDQLGPIGLEPDSNFFDLGGSSVAVAKLAAELRKTYPTADIAELYKNPTLTAMGNYLASLGSEISAREMPDALPLAGKIFQGVWILGINAYTGFRYTVSALLVVWALAVFGDAAWVPHPPLVPLLVAWFFTYAPFGKMLVTAAVTRVLNYNLTPGVYQRGGSEHLRIWAAERFFNYQNHASIDGTPFAPMLYRMLGNKVGKHTALNSGLSVTGLTTIGDNVSIENEVEMSGYWIDGNHVYVGAIDIGDGARVGMRTTVSPGAVIGARAEILPGSHVRGYAEPDTMYEGAPMRNLGPANQNWPTEDPDTQHELGLMYRFESTVLYAVGSLLITLMPAIAFIPGAVWIAGVSGILNTPFYHNVFLQLAVWTVPLVALQQAIWLCLIAATVRLLAVVIKPGFYPQGSFTAWALWLTGALMAQSLESFYFIYASWLTPAWMRMCGAKVGKDVEISTVVVIPHLTTIEDGSFLADDAMACPPRYGNGWVHIGSSTVGTKSFVGNSAIVGIDRDMPSESLLAVLSTAPYHPDSGSSWLGRTANAIPRQKVGADSELTFRPPLRLRFARAFVEMFRLVPLFISFWIDLGIVYAMTTIYVELGMNLTSLGLAVLVSGPIVAIGYTVSCLIPVIVKWLIVGKFRPGNKELHSSFVWRNELSDNFNEYLAVPTLVFLSLGTPFFNMWVRLMGAKVGKDVWCDTWWLPEFDLIELKNRSTVNSGSVIQTHLFHDRVMSLEPVILGEGATLGPSSFVLPGSTIGDRTTIGPASLILRQDQIPPDSVWEGNPVHPVDSSAWFTSLEPPFGVAPPTKART
ncbi:Pls/PosA family non-ribosomal peptide synthetase [Corynebacterium sp.]|uniref:Pls/PosA family non-ribosomal peptide synthetase n=1 Tax=Corynebacterium sp. TaxID=1720 RepID=UPI0026DDA762|nr:Pls/PosA family non-ribosomal peptide synthetase [Corynebacterium sp.]MDO5076542.1 AMP-binding protein [Corynebacterium sp.]